MSQAVLIGEGTSIDQLGVYEQQMREGDYGKVFAFAASAPTPEMLTNMQQTIWQAGVTLTEPVTYDPATGAVVIAFRKQNPALGTIALALGGLMTIGVLFAGWQLIGSMGGGGGAAVGIWIIIGLCAAYIFIKSTEGRETIKASVRATEHIGKAAVSRWGQSPYYAKGPTLRPGDVVPAPPPQIARRPPLENMPIMTGYTGRASSGGRGDSGDDPMDRDINTEK